MYLSQVKSENTIVAQLRSASGSAGGKDVHPRTMKACQDFEAVFLSLLWTEMSKSTGVDLGGWDVLSHQAMGQKWARAGGIGLAKVIYDSVANNPGR